MRRLTRNLCLIATFALLPPIVGCAESELGPSENARTEMDGGVDPGDSGPVSNNATVGEDSGGDIGPSDAGDDAGMVDDAGDPNDAGDAGGEDAGDDAGMTTGPCDALPSAQGWEAVGAPISALPGASDSFVPDIAIDSECRPVVAFHEGTDLIEENVHVYRHDGTVWEKLGPSVDATNQDDKWTIGVRVATSGTTVYIAWAEITLDSEVSVFVATYNETSRDWELVGDTGASGLLSFEMSLVIDPSGRPVVAWNARDGFNMPTTVRVARWQDPNWVALGAPLKDDPTKTASSALSPELVFDSTGALVAAWTESGKIHARRWENGAWSALNGAPIDAVMDPSAAFDANLALAPTGEIIVGWREAAGSTDVYVEAWDGMSWSVIANALDAEPDTNERTSTGNLDVAVDSQGRTVIVFDETIGGNDTRKRVHVWRHDSTGLDKVGAGILDVNIGETSAGSPQVAIDELDRIYVTFIERGMSADEVHVWRYTD